MDKAQFLKDIGRRLKELRGDRTQESICKALSEFLGEERTKESYQHYEAGRRLVPSDVIWGLSQVYGVSVDWILSGKKSLRCKTATKPELLGKFNKDVICIAEFIQSLSKDQREAVKVIIKSMYK